jgi:2-desacetyl-2-hydroxyethyl bacteriochlorophyllide A dehydrogenase
MAGDFGFPVKYGYQVVGTVVAAGRHSGYHEGQAVFAKHPHQDLFTMAVDHPELDPVDRVYVTALDAGIDAETAIFANLADVAANALLDCPVRLGSVVVVLGLGVVGMFCAQLARRTAGRLIVVDPLPARRRLALAFGADLAVEPREALDATMQVSGGHGADSVFEVSGSADALQSAIRVAGPDATVAVVAWYGRRPVELVLSPEFHFRRTRIVSTQVGGLNPELLSRWDYRRRMLSTLDLLPTLHAPELISQRVSLEGVADAYRLVDEHPEQVTAVMISY